jgi:hypothetical protein
MIVLGAVPIDARPMYAARERKACAFCHINPAGGGPRNIRGQFYASRDHKFPDPQPTMDEIREILAQKAAADPSPVASHGSVWDRVTLSSTIIMAHTLTSGEQGESGDCQSCHAGANVPHNKFLLMSGRVNLAVQASDDLTLFWSNDLGITREMYVLYNAVAGKLGLKAGMFTVPFGLKMHDHTTLVKSKLNVGSNKSDVGVAVQGAAGLSFYEAAFTRGGDLIGDATPVRAWGGDNATISATAGVRVGGGRVGAAFMSRRGSFIDRYADTDQAFRPDDNPEGYDQHRFAAFGLYTLGPVYVEGEAIYGTDDETRDGADTDTFTRSGLYMNARYSALDWLDLGARYEFIDISRDHDGDALTHYVFYTELKLARNVALEGRFRLRKESSDVEVNNNDFITLLKIRL